MADLAKNTEKSLLSAPAVVSSAAIGGVMRAIQIAAAPPLLVGAGRDDTQGNPTAPSQSHPRPGILKDIFWRVNAGANTFSIDAKYTGTAPRIIVRANPVLGVMTDQVVTAPGGGGWETLTYTFSAAAKGVVQVWRERLDSDLAHTLHWDHIVVS